LIVVSEDVGKERQLGGRTNPASSFQNAKVLKDHPVLRVWEPLPSILEAPGSSPAPKQNKTGLMEHSSGGVPA
jgi:hypothetical protein